MPPTRDMPPHNPAASRNALPCDRPRPRLTIAVPGFTYTHRLTESYGVKRPAGRTPYLAATMGMCSTGGWGDSDSGVEHEGAGEDVDYSGVKALDGVEIRRAKSTPPSPASCMDVW